MGECFGLLDLFEGRAGIKMQLNNWLTENKQKWWWVSDVTKLDDEAVVEGVLNYGRWKDFLWLKKKMGLKKIKKLFLYMTQEKRRVNLRPERIALFGNYFNRYV